MGLAEIMAPETIAEWLQTPNEWFDDNTPLETIDHGKIDKVWELIYHTREGGFL